MDPPRFHLVYVEWPQQIKQRRRGGIDSRGLVPQWAKDIKKLGVSTINAKAETIMEKSMWKTPFLKRRCLVPADAFY